MSLSHHTVMLAAGASYPVTVGPGAVEGLPAVLAPLAAARAVVVTDSNVEALHAARIADRIEKSGSAVDLVSFPAGEASKTRETKARIEDRLAELGCGRDTVLVAIGGGVTGDLAGFVAATYMRGLPWVQVPTSLLAMADASIGGKTGVDHPAGKNLIGAFHQPAAVLADTDLLATLPEVEHRSGLAEIVKSAVVGDAGLFGRMESSADALRPAGADVVDSLRRAVDVKAGVVSRDERESGERSTLNFGHTIGHALEKLSGYALSHGEAVAAGMVAEARIAVGLRLLAGQEASRIEALLKHLGLPTALPPGTGPGAVLEAAALDKKSRGGRPGMALPARIGGMAQEQGRWIWPVPADLALEVLSGLSRA